MTLKVGVIVVSCYLITCVPGIFQPWLAAMEGAKRESGALLPPLPKSLMIFLFAIIVTEWLHPLSLCMNG